MERQLTLLPDIDDKKVQKEVVSVLKEYRALKMRFSNDVEQEGISLFPELRDSRKRKDKVRSEGFVNFKK
uniref:ArpU family phage transcriptional regulator n=1 Tax=Bacillus cereus HuA4-10 TaxID=1053206 RepID=J8AFC5_BACCE|nr:hypothetical protein IGC_02335 [Bacillus cereus HuA4-10]